MYFLYCRYEQVFFSFQVTIANGKLFTKNEKQTVLHNYTIIYLFNFTHHTDLDDTFVIYSLYGPGLMDEISNVVHLVFQISLSVQHTLSETRKKLKISFISPRPKMPHIYKVSLKSMNIIHYSLNCEDSKKTNSTKILICFLFSQTTYERTTRNRRYNCIDGVLRVEVNVLPSPANSLPLVKDSVNESQRLAKRVKRMQAEARRRAAREKAAADRENELAQRVATLVMCENNQLRESVAASNRNLQQQIRAENARYRDDLASEHMRLAQCETQRADAAIAEGLLNAQRRGAEIERDDPSNHVEGWQVIIELGPMFGEDF